MFISSTKIKDICEHGEHLFYGFTSNKGIDYLLLPDGKDKSTYERVIYSLLNALFGKISSSNENEFTQEAVDYIDNLTANVEDYTAINMECFIGILDYFNLFTPAFLPNCPISVTGILEQYVFSTWLKYYPITETTVIEYTKK